MHIFFFVFMFFFFTSSHNVNSQKCKKTKWRYFFKTLQKFAYNFATPKESYYREIKQKKINYKNKNKQSKNIPPFLMNKKKTEKRKKKKNHIFLYSIKTMGKRIKKNIKIKSKLIYK
jgi:predicted patatin/cPLA2 family phospholipase